MGVEVNTEQHPTQTLKPQGIVDLAAVRLERIAKAQLCAVSTERLFSAPDSGLAVPALGLVDVPDARRRGPFVVEGERRRVVPDVAELDLAEREPSLRTGDERRIGRRQRLRRVHPLGQGVRRLRDRRRRKGRGQPLRSRRRLRARRRGGQSQENPDRSPDRAHRPYTTAAMQPTARTRARAHAANAPGPSSGLGHNSGLAREAALEPLRERAADGSMSASEFLQEAERIRRSFPDAAAPGRAPVVQAAGPNGAKSGRTEPDPVYGYGVRADPGGGRNPDLESRFPWRLHDVDAGGPSAADPKTGAQIGWPEPGVVQGEGVVLTDPRTGDSVLDPDGKPYGVSPEAQRRLRARIEGLLETPVDRMTPAQRAALHEAVTAQRLLFDGPPEPGEGADGPAADMALLTPPRGRLPSETNEGSTQPDDAEGSEQSSEWDKVLDALVDRLNELWEDPEPPTEDPFNGPEDPPPPLVPNPGGQGGRKQRPAPTPSPGPAWTRKAVIRRLLRALSLEEDRDPHPNTDAGKHGARKKR